MVLSGGHKRQSLFGYFYNMTKNYSIVKNYEILLFVQPNYFISQFDILFVRISKYSMGFGDLLQNHPKQHF